MEEIFDKQIDLGSFIRYADKINPLKCRILGNRKPLQGSLNRFLELSSWPWKVRTLFSSTLISMRNLYTFVNLTRVCNVCHKHEAVNDSTNFLQIFFSPPTVLLIFQKDINEFELMITIANKWKVTGPSAGKWFFWSGT